MCVYWVDGAAFVVIVMKMVCNLGDRKAWLGRCQLAQPCIVSQIREVGNAKYPHKARLRTAFLCCILKAFAHLGYLFVPIGKILGGIHAAKPLCMLLFLSLKRRWEHVSLTRPKILTPVVFSRVYVVAMNFHARKVVVLAEPE
jgi:hypothetical protein